MLISLFRVTSWFDTVNNAVTRWMNFRENHLHEHDLIIRLQYLEVFSPKMYKFLVEKYKFSIFAYEFFKVKMKNCK